MSSIFLGMPSYNEEKYILQTIESLQKQSFKNWILFISDNQSTDSTSQICKMYSDNDSRIIHYIQRENIGLINNFKFVMDIYLEKYNNEFFMWTPSNDLWEENFLEECIDLLNKNQNVGSSFCAMTNIDSFNRTIRQYESFKKFTTKDLFKNKIKYLLEPEIMGKCNIFLGIQRRGTIDFISKKTKFDKIYFDYPIAYGLLQKEIIVSDKVLYHKREDRITDVVDYPNPFIIRNVNNGVFDIIKHVRSFTSYIYYEENYIIKIIIILIMIIRLPRSILMTIKSLLILKRKELKKVDIGYGYAYYFKESLLNINDLYVNIKVDNGLKKRNIKNTPHYSFISKYLNYGKVDDINDYLIYKSKFFKGIDIEKQIEAFKTLANNIKKDFENNELDVYIMVHKRRYLFITNKYTIIDGAHRLSILAALGIENIKCKYVDKIEEYEEN